MIAADLVADTPFPTMLSSFHELNYLAILIATVLGFAFGAVWYTLLFGRVWRTEMKLP